MKKLLLAVSLMFVAVFANASVNPFASVTDYTVQFTLNCGPGEALAKLIVNDFNEQSVLRGNSNAVKDHPTINVMINPNTLDYTIVISLDQDSCVLDYGVFDPVPNS